MNSRAAPFIIKQSNARRREQMRTAVLCLSIKYYVKIA